MPFNSIASKNSIGSQAKTSLIRPFLGSLLSLLRIMADPTSRSSLQIPAPIPPIKIQDEPSSSTSSWVPSWFPASPLRGTAREKVSKKLSVGFDDERDTSDSHGLQRHDSGAKETSNPTSIPLKDRFSRKSRHDSVVINMDGSGDAPHNLSVVDESRESKRRPKGPPLVHGRRGPSVRSNFSYDTLKERADVWKKERNTKPLKGAMADKPDSPVKQIVREHSRTLSEFGMHGQTGEDSQRPKICFTKEESDKVDKDILRLMNALEHNKYPFNRDKHVLFTKLRMIRRKQIGLLFAHRELDNTGYYDTDREMFGYDVVGDKFGIMYNVIDAITRDVYELRELLYYERKNQTPPLRRGSADRRSISEPPSKWNQSAAVRTVLGRLPSKDGTDGGTSFSRQSSKRDSTKSLKQSLISPTRPILKHATSAESFKSAKSDDTMTES